MQECTNILQVQMNVLNLQTSIQKLVSDAQHQLPIEQRNQLVMTIILMVNMLSDLVQQGTNEKQAITALTERDGMSESQSDDERDRAGQRKELH